MPPLSLLLLAMTSTYSVFARSPEEREFLHMHTASSAAGGATRPQDTRWKQHRADPNVFHTYLVVNQMNERSRHRRAVKRSGQWVDKVVPYVFSKEVNSNLRKMFREFMDYAENNTCLRFWDKGNASTSHATSPYGPLKTKNFVTIVTSPSCYSIVGGSSTGTMSPCPRKLDYTHEFGHLMGKVHDLALPERNNFIDPNIQNAGPYYWSTQQEMPLGDMDNIMSCGFSAQSIMMYNPYLVTKYGWPTYTFLYDDLGSPTLDSMFMYFKEINIIQGCCGDTDCVSRVCANEGYQGMVDGKCRCVCPSGFDTATNCATVLPTGCGGVFDLSSTQPTVSVTTPGYPGKYDVNVECNWAFKAAEGSQVVLMFSNVDIGCDATLSLGRYMFSDPPIPITKNGKVKPYLSINNKAYVRFTSGNTSCNWNGFNLTAKLAPANDLPYDIASKGESYHGKMNYAMGFEKCLPWSKGYHLVKNLYNITDGTGLDYCDFEGDFCRNCGQKRSKPYCMTGVFERNVTYKYCDVAQAVPPYDLLDDCSSSFAVDPECQDYETRRVCFKSCLDKGKIPDYPAKETPAIRVSCGEPVISNDVIKASTDSAPLPSRTEDNSKMQKWES
ncbi:protein SpAN-like [Haliotis rubra]|uniref:protein SpAN-like n=1 Tax=Haliotis rubra TaxID=36100 RepID=UPI001EE5EEDD|nr:protein SpAN-like [Haliotis rubra]